MKCNFFDHWLLGNGRLKTDMEKNTPSHTAWPAQPRQKWSKLTSWLAGLAVALLLISQYYGRHPSIFLCHNEYGIGDWCPLPHTITPAGDGLSDSSHLMSTEQHKLQAERLGTAVQVPTESFDDNGEVDEDPRWKTFDKFHQVLEELFPLVHSNLERQKVNKYGLLFKLQGSNASLKPVLFTAHQDVVPAGSHAEWKYPPFAGHYDGTWVWGRGAADCKNVLIGLLSVMEDLLSQSFRPQRTIVLAFGFDEETGGVRGASRLNQFLLEQYGKDSFAFLMDEGGNGVKTLGDVMYAYPAVGEKGYYDAELRLTVRGGHSSKPPPHTGIGIFAQAIVALEDRPYTPLLPQWSPFRRALECNTKYSPHSVQPWLKDALLHDSEEEVASRLAQVLTSDKWLMQTSQAVDVVTGGVKVNALPETVTVKINHRVALHQSVEDVNRHIQSIVEPIAEKNGLQFRDLTNADSDYSSENSTVLAGTVELRSGQLLPPAPISPTDNSVWAVFSGTLRSVFETSESGLNKTVVPVGNIMTGNTDTTHYWDLTRNIYRYSPARDGTRLDVHATDERMLVEAHLEGMRVYYDLIRNFDSLKDG